MNMNDIGLKLGQGFHAFGAEGPGRGITIQPFDGPARAIQNTVLQGLLFDFGIRCDNKHLMTQRL